MELAGKTAIVTGASRGIGRAIALALGMEGASVVVAARTEKDLIERASGLKRGEGQITGRLPGTIHKTAEELRAIGAQALAIPCDVTREDDIKRLVDQTLQRFGKIDILVNNAGVYPRGHHLEVTPEEFDQVMRVNVLSMCLTCKHVLPHMIRQRAGNIINLGSGTGSAGHRGTTIMNEKLFLYGVSKAAVNRLTTYIAAEVAEHGIAVNAISPGMVIRTAGLDDALPEGYAYNEGAWVPAEPEVVRDPIIFLATQTSRTFTGRVVTIREYRKTWP